MNMLEKDQQAIRVSWSGRSKRLFSIGECLPRHALILLPIRKMMHEPIYNVRIITHLPVFAVKAG